MCRLFVGDVLLMIHYSVCLTVCVCVRVQSPEMVASVGKLSYNQLVEKIIDYKHSADSSRVSEGNARC